MGLYTNRAAALRRAKSITWTDIDAACDALGNGGVGEVFGVTVLKFDNPLNFSWHYHWEEELPSPPVASEAVSYEGVPASKAKAKL
jgi:hypothetical protein